MHVRTLRPPRRRTSGHRPSPVRRLVGVAVTAATAVCLLPGVAAADEPGESNTITDVPGILVGHETRTGNGYQTGTTVVLADGEAATASSTTFGGAPGTRETDLLEPGGLVTAADAIVLSGGSAYGLDTATGVMEWLEEQGQGYNVGQGVVPIVPAAILFDLGRGGDFSARPDAGFGYAAIAGASDDPVPMGRVGAGTGASWGLGSASVVLDNGWTVGAIVGLNAAGSPVDPATCKPYGEFLELADEFDLNRSTPGNCPALRDRARAGDAAAAEPFNTTIALVATDAPLDQTQAQRMSMIANSGLARSIRPVHGMFDGDTVFAMATTPPDGSLGNGQLNQLYNAAADALGRAVVHAVLEGETLGNRVAYCEQYPRICGDRASQSGRSATSDGAVVPLIGSDPAPPAASAAGPATGERSASPGVPATASPVVVLVATAALLVVVAVRLRRRRPERLLA